MCGIFGYIGKKSAPTEIVKGLQRLEYRWYDSAGICFLDTKNHPHLVKSVGKVSELATKVELINKIEGNIGIGHTRWATHGKVTETNCHPHFSQSKRFFIVHNGIIENYSRLRSQLQEQGIEFYSQTDTEVVAKLFENEFEKDMRTTLVKVTSKLEGAYSLVVLDTHNPETLFGAKLGSPLVIWIGKEDMYISSDYRSLIGKAEEYVTLEDGDMFFIEKQNYRVLSSNGFIDRQRARIEEEASQLELGPYPHYMLKEIFEEPEVLSQVFAGRVDFQNKDITSHTLEKVSEMGFEKVAIIGMGSSYFSWCVGQYYLEELAGIETEMFSSSEFKYKKKFIKKDTLYIFVSQSWETAETLDCLKIVKEKWGFTFGIVNVAGSSISRLSDTGLFMHAGVEVWVASTKAFIATMGVFLSLALYLGKKRSLETTRLQEIVTELEQIPEKMRSILQSSEGIRTMAKKYSEYDNFFFLGRAHELPIAHEASLKLKEITYKHSESYASGELKHGPFALIQEDFPTVIINGNSSLHVKNISSIEEIKSRGGKVLGIVADNESRQEVYDDLLTFPASLPELNVFLEVMVIHLFAYHMANHIGNNVDKPRNLAKSVTVE